jgi:hypothetical protein
MDLTVLAGPAALAIAASLAVVALWKEHVKGDGQKDATIKTLAESVGAFPGALKELTAVVSAATERERDRTPR